MSKFLKICEKYDSLLNEQEEGGMPPDTNQQPQPTEQPQTEQPIDNQTQSEERVATNEEIANLLKSMQIFFSNENSELSDDNINEIKKLNPTSSKEDVDIKNVITTLTTIFNPVSIKTEPETVKDSTFNN
jgi:hypothetical protein